MQRETGLRPRESEVDSEGEVGDPLLTLIAFANGAEIDLERSLERVLRKEEDRDDEKRIPTP